MVVIFCFFYDNGEVRYAKRKGIIKENDYFFGYKKILDFNLEKIRLIFSLLKKDKAFIYGELFGGIYPGMTSDVNPVQSGIYYSPNLEFYAFDISYINDSNVETYLNYDLSIDLFKKKWYNLCRTIVFNF